MVTEQLSTVPNRRIDHVAPLDTTNPYLQQVHAVLPRLLAMFDTEQTSPSFGLGDRYHWAWKCIDFANGTYQGAAHGLSRLLAAGLLPEYLSEQSVFARIDAMFKAADRIRRRNGSFEEALPYEGSFCVTALVAYDLLSALERLAGRLTDVQRQEYLDVVRPMIGFLHHADETHAFISNHLATAVAALFKWTDLTGEDGDRRATQLLDQILEEASPEGWFREYEGADPGYQTLSMYYLADVHRMRPDLGLFDTLEKSVQFLSHFAHPDGSFAGHYGSRNTRFYYPAGIQALANTMPVAAALSRAMAESIRVRRTVTLETMDAPNLIPMFNAYCWAAAEYESCPSESDTAVELPAEGIARWQKTFAEAGLFIDNGPEHYTIIALNKGGVCYHFSKSGDQTFDAGAVYRNPHGTLYSSQTYTTNAQIDVTEQAVAVTAPLRKMHNQSVTPLKFLILRLLSLTVMRWRPAGERIKQLLVRYLITGTSRSPGRNRRTIRLGPQLTIEDECVDASESLSPQIVGTFKAIHMASSGYWQRQDDER
jgi:hypothetical protein